jgi:dihydroorotate dehydrogenase (NAD+) catalytic subunit
VTGIPIVGMGGVGSGRDVLEMIACGATHVGLGTVLFADPGAPSRVREELSIALSNAGFDNSEEAFSAAQEAVFLSDNQA